MAAILGLDDGRVIEACAEAPRRGGRGGQLNAPPDRDRRTSCRVAVPATSAGGSAPSEVTLAVRFVSLEPARVGGDRLRVRLASVDVPPLGAVINNVDAGESDPQPLRTRWRASGGPVRWTQIIQAMSERASRSGRVRPGKVSVADAPDRARFRVCQSRIRTPEAGLVACEMNGDPTVLRSDALDGEVPRDGGFARMTGILMTGEWGAACRTATSRAHRRNRAKIASWRTGKGRC